MKTIFLALAAATLAASARAQSETLAASGRSFETSAAEAIQPFVLEDSFAGIASCSVLDIRTIRAWTLEEASDMANPCLQAVGAKYQTPMTLQAGLIAVSADGQPARPGLLLVTELAPGSKPHRDLIASLARRHGELLGHQVRLLVRGEVAPESVSAVQEAIRQCIMTSVVRDIRNGADFIKIYGSCLTRNPDLKIADLRAGNGLTVVMTTQQPQPGVEALNGFVTVNAGRGPVRLTVVATSARL